MYEILICLTIIIITIQVLVIELTRLNIKIEENREAFQMKQFLYANLMLLENNEPLLPSTSEYQFIIDEEKICIEWNDLNGHKQFYCENYKE